MYLIHATLSLQFLIEGHVELISAPGTAGV